MIEQSKIITKKSKDAFEETARSFDEVSVCFAEYHSYGLNFNNTVRKQPV